MGIGDAFDAVTDWAMEGSTLWSLTKFFGIVSLGMAALASPFFIIANHNENAFKNEVAEIDGRPSVIFNSAADCAAKGFDQTACKASQDAAMDIAGSLGTEVSYSSGADCEQSHQSCDARTTTTTTFINAGNNVLVPVTTTTTSYYPHIVGWQAERDRLNRAVPLYQGPSEGKAMRGDGRILTLDPR
jgi:hypothetical protein